MKRVIFAAILLALLIGFNCFCLITIRETKNEATEKLDTLQSFLESENIDKTASECEKFADYWHGKHHVLSRIVRHELLDQTAMSVSRFVPLAKFGETGELASEINRCKFLLEEIYDSERPFLRNIF
ncbi:MAG: DUF4363 family protein [Oscillospiraceae bacterium]|nr:DUF4363 family protein [Oscillospiraceae bacterium]